jgi:hypothetical protein
MRPTDTFGIARASVSLIDNVRPASGSSCSPCSLEALAMRLPRVFCLRAHPRCPVTWIPALTLARLRHDAGMTFGVDVGVANVRHPRSRAARGYRGSTHACPADVRSWIPAFAGMTFGVEVSGDQLASLPARIRVRAELRREARARFRALTWIPACAGMTFEPLSSRPSGARAGTQGPRTSNAAPVAPGSRIFACGEFRDDSLREARGSLSPPLRTVAACGHRCLRRDVDGPIHCPPWQRAAPGRRASGSRSGRPGSHPFPARRQQWRRTGDCLMRLKVDGAPMRRTPKRDLGQKSPTRVPEGNPRAVRPWSLETGSQGDPRGSPGAHALRGCR